MDLRFQALRAVCWLLWLVTWPAALLGVVVAVASFGMPEIELTRLYQWSLVTNRVGMTAIFTTVALGFGLGWLVQPFAGVNKAIQEVTKRRGLLRRVAWVAMAAVMLAVWVFPGWRYVHPEGSRWIATGKAIPSEVSAEVARLYLWRLIRMDASFVLVAVWVLGGYSWAVLTGIKKVEMSGEELMPSVVTHVRPRDYRG